MNSLLQLGSRDIVRARQMMTVVDERGRDVDQQTARDDETHRFYAPNLLRQGKRTPAGRRNGCATRE